MTTYPKTARLMQRGADFLGSETAILCGAMSWVSERNLVSAISNAGAKLDNALRASTSANVGPCVVL